eukprot:1155344-Pelagomonas_calceolata.AAC.3
MQLAQGPACSKNGGRAQRWKEAPTREARPRSATGVLSDSLRAHAMQLAQGPALSKWRKHT